MLPRPSALVLAALLSLPPIASRAGAQGFDFALERIEISGNGAFVDEFDDGRRDLLPTRALIERDGSRVTESAGRLLLTDRDGASRGIYDAVTSNRLIKPGAGDATIRIAIRPDVPSDDVQEIGLALDDPEPNGGFTRARLSVRRAVAPSVGTSPCVQDGALAIVFRGPDDPQDACAFLDPSALGPLPLVLRIDHDDATHSVLAAYSLDGGTTFQLATSWSKPTDPQPLPPDSGALALRIFARGSRRGGILTGTSTAPDEARDPGGALIGLTGELRSGGASAESFALASAGGLDLRATPGTLSLDGAGFALAASAIRANGVRRVDLATGQPLDPAHPAQSRAGFEAPLAFPGESAASRSFAYYLSNPLVLAGGILPISAIFSSVLAGAPLGSVALSVIAGASAPPLVPLATPLSLETALSSAELALLGCGPDYGTTCSSDGLDLFHAEAGALLQSFPGLPGSDDPAWLANDGLRAQPGTTGFGGGDAPCLRGTPGGSIVVPGCREPADPGFDPAVDGETGPFLHPLTGQVFRSETAALSWNLLVLLAALSPAEVGQPPGPDAFDPASPDRTDGCSFARPQLCSFVRLALGLSARTLDDDPSGEPRRRWLWELGADYRIDSSSGPFAGLEGATLHAAGPAAPTPAAAAGIASESTFLALRVDTPAPDADQDGVADALDHCPGVADPLQTDRGGIGAGSPPDGIGDACQCGDVTGDGRVTAADAAAIQRSLLVPPKAALAHPERCDVGGSTGCSTADAAIVQRALLVPPKATIEQPCAGAPEP